MDKKELRTLIQAVEDYSTNMNSEVHGPQHWKCVSKLGIQLARKTPGADAEVAFLFGLFHDSMRENDHRDPEHGLRGAKLALEMVDRGLLSLTTMQIGQLIYACTTHTDAPPTTDPTIGVCYDADRLNLWRVGKQPRIEFISTNAGGVIVYSCATRDWHYNPLEWTNITRSLLRK